MSCIMAISLLKIIIVSHSRVKLFNDRFGAGPRLAHEASKARDSLALTRANVRRWCSRAISSWKSAKVDLARLESWPRQCRNRLTLIIGLFAHALPENDRARSAILRCAGSGAAEPCFHPRRQRRRQVFDAQTAPGVLLELFDKQRLGPVMFDIVVLLALPKRGGAGRAIVAAGRREGRGVSARRSGG